MQWYSFHFINISNFLSDNDVLGLTFVCRAWQDILYHDPLVDIVWKRLLHHSNPVWLKKACLDTTLPYSQQYQVYHTFDELTLPMFVPPTCEDPSVLYRSVLVHHIPILVSGKELIWHMSPIPRAEMQNMRDSFLPSTLGALGADSDDSAEDSDEYDEAKENDFERIWNFRLKSQTLTLGKSLYDGQPFQGTISFRFGPRRISFRENSLSRMLNEQYGTRVECSDIPATRPLPSSDAHLISFFLFDRQYHKRTCRTCYLFGDQKHSEYRKEEDKERTQSNKEKNEVQLYACPDFVRLSTSSSGKKYFFHPNQISSLRRDLIEVLLKEQVKVRKYPSKRNQ